MKIITVTLNPAIDKTVYLPELVKGSCNRICKETVDAGGKGINVSKTLLALGQPSIAVAFAGGAGGQKLKTLAEEYGLQMELILTSKETRTNVKIVEENKAVTELNEPGPEIGKEELEKMLSCLEKYADKDTLFVLSGSLPKGVPVNFYAEMIELVHKKGAKVLLDSSGEAFLRGVEAGPEFVKPNLEELMQYTAGCDKSGQRTKERESTAPEVTKEQIVCAGRKLLEKKVQTVVISMGEQGACFLTRQECIFGQGLNVEVHSTVGAGDAMAAAISYGAVHQFSLEETAKWAIAVSAGAVMTYGTRPADKAVTEELFKKVEIASFFI